MMGSDQRRFNPRVDSKLLIKFRQVALNGAHTQIQPCSDGLVAQAFGQKR